MTSSTERSDDVHMVDCRKLQSTGCHGDKTSISLGVENKSFTHDVVDKGRDMKSEEPEKEFVAVSHSDDEDNDENWLARQVIRFQDAVNLSWQRHERCVASAVKVIFLVAYLIYFGFAMHHSRLRDEASIRLLWVTCLVVTCLLVKGALRCCRKYDVRTPSHWFMWARLSGRQRLINRAVLFVLYLLIVLFVIVDVAVVSRNPYNLVSVAGMFTLVGLLFIFSHNPAKVRWPTVLWGLSLQFIFALVILRSYVGLVAFQWLGDRVSEFLSYADVGSRFTFGASYMDHFFAFKLLPVIIFFSCIIAILFYWGVMNVLIRKVAYVMQITMGTTAAESMAAAGNIFLGQSEAPLMIRPLLPEMTKSELHAVMTGGFATIAGAVMAAYILFGVPANHLLSASIMSAPAALACAKIFYPETEKSKTTVTDVTKMETGSDINVLDAASNGASNAVPLVANIAANIIAFISLLEFVNVTLTWFGQRVGIEKLTFQMICSYVLWPLAAVMGADIDDCRKVAQLIGTKTVLNEFVAYTELKDLLANRKALDAHVTNNGTWYWRGDDIIMTSSSSDDVVLLNGIISARSVLISTYALCGFSNFGSIGVQLGALGAMAPARRQDIASVAFRAMIAGNVACFMTACVAADSDELVDGSIAHQGFPTGSDEMNTRNHDNRPATHPTKSVDDTTVTFDDLVSNNQGGTRFVRHAMKYQTSFDDCWKRHAERVFLVVYVILIVAYFAYFTYALYFRFGDIDSVRLLYITCVVVAVMAWQLLKHCTEIGKVPPLSSWPPIKYCIEYEVVVSWSTPLTVCKG